MKIGDEVYVHGYVDEIRGDTVIIKNKGGYFGTCKKEVETERDYDQVIYLTDKFMAVVYEDRICLLRKDRHSVTIDNPTDCAWK